MWRHQRPLRRVDVVRSRTGVDDAVGWTVVACKVRGCEERGLERMSPVVSGPVSTMVGCSVDD